MAQRLLNGLLNRPELESRAQKLGHIQDTVGAPHLGSQAVKFLVATPEFERPAWPQDLLDQPDHLTGCREARIRDIVDPKGCAAVPKFQASPHTLPAMGEGVD